MKQELRKLLNEYLEQALVIGNNKQVGFYDFINWLNKKDE